MILTKSQSIPKVDRPIGVCFFLIFFVLINQGEVKEKNTSTKKSDNSNETRIQQQPKKKTNQNGNNSKCVVS